jgi:hypothetical protein
MYECKTCCKDCLQQPKTSILNIKQSKAGYDQLFGLQRGGFSYQRANF